MPNPSTDRVRRFRERRRDHQLVRLDCHVPADQLAEFRALIGAILLSFGRFELAPMVRDRKTGRLHLIRS